MMAFDQTRAKQRRCYGAVVLIGAISLSSPCATAAPPITSAAFAPDGKQLVTGSTAGIAVWSWPDLQPLKKLATQLDHVHDLAFSPRGDLLAAVGGFPAEAGRLELWTWPEGKLQHSASPHDDVTYSVAWSSDGQKLATAGGDRKVLVHSLPPEGGTTNKLIGHSHGVLAVRYLPGDMSLVSAGRDQSLRLWEVGSGKALRTFDNHTGAVVGLAVRPGQTEGTAPWVASIGADRTLRFWQPTIGRLVRFAKLESEPLAIEWTADGARAVVSSVDGKLRVIDPDTVELLTTLPALDGWAYTLLRAPQTNTFLVAGNGGQMKAVAIGEE